MGQLEQPTKKKEKHVVPQKQHAAILVGFLLAISRDTAPSGEMAGVANCERRLQIASSQDFSRRTVKVSATRDSRNLTPRRPQPCIDRPIWAKGSVF
jgi:hypothetical protein